LTRIESEKNLIPDTSADQASLKDDGIDVTTLKSILQNEAIGYAAGRMNLFSARHDYLDKEEYVHIRKYKNIVDAILYLQVESLFNEINEFLIDFLSLCKQARCSEENIDSLVERMNNIVEKYKLLMQVKKKINDDRQIIENYSSVIRDIIRNFGEGSTTDKAIRGAIKDICDAKGAAVDASIATKQGGNKRSGNKRSGNKRSGNKRSGNKRSGNKRSGNKRSNKRSRSRSRSSSSSISSSRLYSKTKTRTKRHRNKSKKQ
jgi:hypothetical protein